MAPTTSQESSPWSHSTSTLPREVIIAHERFIIKKYIPRLSLCQKCWVFGNPEDVCTASSACRMCSNNHDENNQCTSAKKCPTSLRNDHAAGTAACSIFASKQQVIKYAYTHPYAPQQITSSALKQPSKMGSTPAPLPLLSSWTSPRPTMTNGYQDYF